jgi:flagellar motor switch protein FliN/FliY
MHMTADIEGQATAPVVSNVNPLHLVKTKLRVIVGELDISVGDLLAAKEHQVLALSTALDQAVDLVLEGHTVARGQLVAVDGNFAVRITELPVAL